MHTLLVITVSAVSLVVAYLAVLALLVVKFPGLFYPRVFIADDLSGYGIRKPTLLRTSVINTALIISELIEIGTVAALTLLRRDTKNRTPWLYRHARRNAWVTDPAEADVKSMTRDAMTMYLQERASVFQAMVAEAGWRRAFLRYTIELPSNEAQGPKTLEVDGKKIPLPAMRLTKFVLY